MRGRLVEARYSEYLSPLSSGGFLQLAATRNKTR
jgi:hypothetical protein